MLGTTQESIFHPPVCVCVRACVRSRIDIRNWNQKREIMSVIKEKTVSGVTFSRQNLGRISLGYIGS